MILSKRLKCMEQTNNTNHIRWQCRRGMLELDEMLLNFFINHYQQLSVTMQQIFSNLLQESDADLFDWLIGKTLPIDVEFRNLILFIIKTTYVRFNRLCHVSCSVLVVCCTSKPTYSCTIRTYGRSFMINMHLLKKYNVIHVF